jgi:hypothetical protein
MSNRKPRITSQAKELILLELVKLQQAGHCLAYLHEYLQQQGYSNKITRNIYISLAGLKLNELIEPVKLGVMYSLHEAIQNITCNTSSPVMKLKYLEWFGKVYNLYEKQITNKIINECNASNSEITNEPEVITEALPAPPIAEELKISDFIFG